MPGREWLDEWIELPLGAKSGSHTNGSVICTKSLESGCLAGLRVQRGELMADTSDPGRGDWPAARNANGGRSTRPRGVLRVYWEPTSGVVAVISAVLGTVTAVTGLLSALVATGIIHGPASSPQSTTPAPVVSVMYSAEGLQLRLGQCFNLDTGQAQCGEEDIALPERQVGILGISNGAQANQLGVRSLRDYNALDPVTLKGLSYSNVRVVNVTAGLLIAVKTHGGNFAKIWVSIVQTPDYTLKVTNYHTG